MERKTGSQSSNKIKQKDDSDEEDFAEEFPATAKPIISDEEKKSAKSKSYDEEDFAEVFPDTVPIVLQPETTSKELEINNDSAEPVRVPPPPQPASEHVSANNGVATRDNHNDVEEAINNQITNAPGAVAVAGRPPEIATRDSHDDVEEAINNPRRPSNNDTIDELIIDPVTEPVADPYIRLVVAIEQLPVCAIID